MQKKLTFILCSLLSAGAMGIAYLLPIEFNGMARFGLFVIALAVQWMFLVRVFQYRIVLSKLFFYFLFSFGMVWLLESFPTLGMIAQVLFILGMSVFAYFLLLALNIYFVSEKQEVDIPLIQPAKVVVTTAIVLTVFFWTILIYKLPYVIHGISPWIVIALVVILLLIFYALFFPSLLWYIVPSREGEIIEEKRQNGRRALALIVVVLLELSLMLMGYPYETFARAALISVTAYVLINIAMQYLAHKLSKRLYIESTAIILATYLIVYLI